MKLDLRLFEPEDFDAWLPLWAEYEPASWVKGPVHARLIFDQIVNPDTLCEGIMAFMDGKAVGFAHLIYLHSIEHTRNIAYLEDLLVTKAYQGKRIGATLGEFCLARAKEKNCAQLFGITRPQNTQAQKLYDHYATREEWLRYAINLES